MLNTVGLGSVNFRAAQTAQVKQVSFGDKDSVEKNIINTFDKKLESEFKFSSEQRAQIFSALSGTLEDPKLKQKNVSCSDLQIEAIEKNWELSEPSSDDCFGSCS